MTEYTDRVEEVRLQQEVEEWAKGAKYIHLNNSIIEVKQLNGDIHYWDLKTDKKWTVFKNLSKEDLYSRFLKLFKLKKRENYEEYGQR